LLGINQPTWPNLTTFCNNIKLLLHLLSEKTLLQSYYQ
jgi:hypothetical protein